MPRVGVSASSSTPIFGTCSSIRNERKRVMVDDVVDRLKNWSANPDRESSIVAGALMLEAAAEIERLRAILRRCVPGTDAMDIGGEMIGLHLREDRSFA